ncbi:MAG: (d)CMP kinase [Spirochaetia bacterium]|nr:(d)CMP kinase [Spirochaetia bacterium]
MVITLDGPAGSGKSTVAKVIAKKLSLNQIDSGAMYRSYTHLCLSFAKEQKMKIKDVIDSKNFKDYLAKQKLVIEFHSGRQIIHLNGKDMEQFIRQPEITENIKFVADARFVREMVNEQIGVLAKDYSIIADGRDMGTVVFPNADFKFFLTASLEVRASRRLEEFKRINPEFTIDQVMREIEKRDHDDENREFGQLKPAQNAIFVDTTNLDLNGVVNVIINIIQNKR